MPGSPICVVGINGARHVDGCDVLVARKVDVGSVRRPLVGLGTSLVLH